MNKYECLDEGDFWAITKNGIAIDCVTVVDDIKALQVMLDGANARLSSFGKLAAAGVYYTEEELDNSKLYWEKVAVSKAKKSIQADTITKLIADHVHDANIDGVSEAVISVVDAEKVIDELLGEGK